MMKWLAISVVVGGCAAAAQQRDSDTLDQSIHIYNENVRWERFAKAAVLLPPRQRADAIEQWDERAHDLKISDWELIKLAPHGAGEVRAHVKLSWYKPSEEIVRTTDAVQTWHKLGHNWLLIDETRLRGDEMPGLAEPHPTHAAVPKREETR
jgi:hypothetical protein